MTKARTKAERRRAKRKITLPGGEVRAVKAGQGRRVDVQPPADALALAIRVKHTGCRPDDARAPILGDDMGRCIWALHGSTPLARDLGDVWAALTAAWRNYASRCLSLSETPQAAALPMLPEPMQTDPSLRIDPRTSEERDEAARRVWFDWLERLMDLPPDQRHAVRGELQRYGAPLWNADARAPTRHGCIAVNGLAALHLARGH